MTEVEESNLVKVAYTQISLLEKAVRWTKFQIRVIGGLCVVLLAGAVIIGFLYANQVSLAHTLQLGSIAGCEQSNIQRATDKDNWDYFLAILLRGNTNKTYAALGKQIEAHVDEGDKMRNCISAYGG